jgi:hypothetical protein
MDMEDVPRQGAEKTMQTRYIAYGLELRCSFALPGMTPSTAGRLPLLNLELATPVELENVWSGTDGPPLWRGRLGDGHDLTIEQGRAGDLLFAYGERARFRLDAELESLLCAPVQAGLDWQRALISKVLSSISVMRGYEALHAGVVDSREGVVAIMGPSGSGKSTLANELLRRGWPLFADDALTLEDVDRTVRAHPGTPHMNLAQELPDAIDTQTVGSTLGILAHERWVVAEKVTQHPRPVRMLCLLERGPGQPLEIRTLPRTPLSLAPYMLGLSIEAERQRSRFNLYADLMESATLVRLTAGLEHPPARLADLVEQALLRHPEPVAAGIA